QVDRHFPKVELRFVRDPYYRDGHPAADQRSSRTSSPSRQTGVATPLTWFRATAREGQPGALRKECRSTQRRMAASPWQSSGQLTRSSACVPQRGRVSGLRVDQAPPPASTKSDDLLAA